MATGHKLPSVERIARLVRDGVRSLAHSSIVPEGGGIGLQAPVQVVGGTVNASDPDWQTASLATGALSRPAGMRGAVLGVTMEPGAAWTTGEVSLKVRGSYIQGTQDNDGAWAISPPPVAGSPHTHLLLIPVGPDGTIQYRLTNTPGINLYRRIDFWGWF